MRRCPSRRRNVPFVAALLAAAVATVLSGGCGSGRLPVAPVEGTVKLQPKDRADPHLLVALQTLPNRRNDLGGADGLTFDAKGNLYAGNFGDGRFFRVALNEDGSVGSNTLLVEPPKLTCVDGMLCDLKTGKIYVADSEKNAIQVVSPGGAVSALWENGDTDGADGLLDQPCEVIVRGDELIVACFDMPFPGLKNTMHDAPHTICVIKLK